jgi:hypothetical protein
MYLWGFLFWGALPLGYRSWKSTPDDRAAGQALLSHFPETGTYYIPSMKHDSKELEALMVKGPVGFVHIKREGRPLADPSIMVGGLILYLAVAALLSFTMPSSDRYAVRFAGVFLVGLTAVVMVDLGDAIWWQIPWAWKLTQAGYNVVTVSIAGAILAKFSRRRLDMAN